MFRGHICLSRISDFVVYMNCFFAYVKSHCEEGRVISKIKQNELDCRDTAPLKSSVITHKRRKKMRKFRKDYNRDFRKLVFLTLAFFHLCCL